MQRTLLLLLVLGAVDASAATDAATLARTRGRAGAWAGVGVLNGHLAFSAPPTAEIETAITAVPVVALGVDLWPDEHLGLMLDVDLGTGAALDVPDVSGTLRYNLHQLRLGGRYRWHFGPGADASALFVGLGLGGLYQSAQRQRPSLLVDRLIAGPELCVGGEWVALPDRLWVRLDGRLAVPFFVRESPADSGDPTSFIGYGGALSAIGRVTGPWSVQAELALYFQTIDFNGEGTRVGQVFDATTDDRFLTATLAARYGF